MRQNTMTIIFIVFIVTFASLTIYGAEASEANFLERRADCLAHLKLCKKNKDCCSKKCSRRGTNPEQRCR
uniref:Intrepicalcin n=1 Tax=Thorellius intrepidus TaxID=1533001 RepID=CAINT_THOIN|nr:RecName: Full=Intrepicalcin; AltName: Full=ViCaTx1; Flags: Precursor [Thorellius intrepidus]